MLSHNTGDNMPINQKLSRTSGRYISSFLVALILSFLMAPSIHAAEKNQTSKPGIQQTMTIDGKNMTFNVQCILKHAYHDKGNWNYKTRSNSDPSYSEMKHKTLEEKLELLNKAITTKDDKDWKNWTSPVESKSMTIHKRELKNVKDTNITLQFYARKTDSPINFFENIINVTISEPTSIAQNSYKYPEMKKCEITEDENKVDEDACQCKQDDSNPQTYCGAHGGFNSWYAGELKTFGVDLNTFKWCHVKDRNNCNEDKHELPNHQLYLTSGFGVTRSFCIDNYTMDTKKNNLQFK